VDEAVRLVLAERVKASTPTRSAIIAAAEQRLEATYGPGVVPSPSRATACRRLEELTKGTNAVRGSAKGRRSNAERPQGVYGRLHPTRPGEYLVLDTQDLDVFAMEPVTCRWVGVQLTIAQDLFSRCICGLRCTPVSTKAVDVAGRALRRCRPAAATVELAGRRVLAGRGVLAVSRAAVAGDVQRGRADARSGLRTGNSGG
jgi:hypothetical protein